MGADRTGRRGERLDRQSARHGARASLFAAQAIARDLIAAGREKEVDEIREFISTIVPNPDAKPSAMLQSGAQSSGTTHDDL